MGKTAETQDVGICTERVKVQAAVARVRFWGFGVRERRLGGKLPGLGAAGEQRGE